MTKNDENNQIFKTSLENLLGKGRAPDPLPEESELDYLNRVADHLSSQPYKAPETPPCAPRLDSIKDHPRAFLALAATMIATATLAGLPGIATLYVAVKLPVWCMQDNLDTAFDKQQRDAQNFLFHNAKEGNLLEVKRCLNQGANINAHYTQNTDHLGYNYYGVAYVRKEYYNTLTTMTEDDFGKTALMLAVENGHPHMAQQMVTLMGADPTMTTRKGHTASDLARRAGYHNIANWLDSLNQAEKSPEPQAGGPKPPAPHVS